jgi:hypothetical protein
MNRQTYMQENQKEVLAYLKTRLPIYHLSNLFFRDLQFGIQAMFREKGARLGYTESEKLARTFVEGAERAQIFTPIDGQSWRVNYPEFRLPQRKKPAAKPKPAARPAPAPAAGGEAAKEPLPREKSSPADQTPKKNNETQ